MTDQTEKTTTQLLAEIGVSHQPSSHFNRRRLVTANERTIDFMDCFEANAFVAAAHSAA
jgi:hypothetical protein